MKHHLVHEDGFEDDYSNVIIDKKIYYPKMEHIKLKFNKSQAFRVYDEFYNRVFEDDGYLFVELDLPSDYVYSYILSFGNDVEVLEPEEVRVELKNRLDSMIKKY